MELTRSLPPRCHPQADAVARRSRDGRSLHYWVLTKLILVKKNAVSAILYHYKRSKRQMENHPFLMAFIRVIGSRFWAKTEIQGFLYHGTVEVSDKIDIVTDEGIITREVLGIKENNIRVSKATCSQAKLNILVREFVKDDFRDYFAIVPSGTTKIVKYFEANLYVLTKEEGGRHTPIFDGFRPEIYVERFGQTWHMTGNVRLQGGIEHIATGTRASVSISLLHFLPMNVGDKFTIRENQKVIATGTVTKLNN